MKEDMKTMKALMVEVRLEKRYVVSVGGEKVGIFREVGSLCGLKQLSGPAGIMVIDPPSDFEVLLQTILQDDSTAPFDASVIKASPQILQKMKEAVAIIKAKKDAAEADGETQGQDVPARTPVSPDDSQNKAEE